MDIVAKIDRLRYERGWSVYKMADECGLTQSTLANMFTRKTLPSIRSLINICNGFGISLSQFFAENADDVSTEEEASLIMAFKKLSLKNRTAVRKLIDNLK